MAQLFANKHWLDLALAMTEAGMTEAEVRSHLQKSGIGTQQHEAFLQNVRILEAVRVQAHCHECDAFGNHIDENTLAEFVDGVLEEHEVAEVERQFARCASCLRKAVELAQLTEELVAAPRLPQVVLGIARNGLRFIAQPVAAFFEHPLESVPVLGDESATACAKRWRVAAGHLEAEFLAVMDEEQRVSLSVQISRNDVAVQHGRATLRHHGLLVESVPLTAQGEARFNLLQQGAYTIEAESGTDHGAFPILLSTDQ